MRLLVILLVATLVLFCSGGQNVTKSTRKTLRSVKALKKSSLKARKTTTEQDKSESYHLPLIVSAPVSLEVHENDRYIQAADHPIHLVEQPLNYHPSDLQDIGGPYDSNHKSIAPGEYYSEHYRGSSIPGSAGVDYPTYSHLPTTGFKCLQHTLTPGFYADVETKCQMWHYCQPDGRHDRFLCPNGTIFDQLTRVCNWWFNVHCDSSLDHYGINFDLYKEPLGTKSVSSQTASYQGTPSITHPNSFLRHVEDFEAARHSNIGHPQGIIEARKTSPLNHQYSEHQSIDDNIYTRIHRPSDSKFDSGHQTIDNDRYTRPTYSVVQGYPSTDSKFDSSYHTIDDESYTRPLHAGHFDSQIDPTAHQIIDVEPTRHRYPVKMAPSPLVRHDSIDYDSSNAHSLTRPSDRLKQQKSENLTQNDEAEYSTVPQKKRKRIARRRFRKPNISTSGDDIPTYREAKATPAARRYRVVRRRKISKV